LRKRTPFILVLLILVSCLLVWVGWRERAKSTPELIADLKSPQEKDRIIAVRLLPQRTADVAQTVPALIEALKDKGADIRWSAAIGLGHLGESAKEAIPALQGALSDRDARVREGAGVALSRIDPARFTPPHKHSHAGK
jgi:HEAT repeat protein